MNILNEGQATGEKPFCFMCAKRVKEEHFFCFALRNFLVLIFHGGCFADAMEKRRRELVPKG
jgi:hypothetical protein